MCGGANHTHKALCRRCQGKERACIDCGRQFTSTSLRCNSCTSAERECTECGRAFRGMHKRCGTCRAQKRECLTCGKTFSGTNLTCPSCLMSPRPCRGCGRAFNGRESHCPACVASARTCVTCGRQFKGRAAHCPPCQATERECGTCGRLFRGDRPHCPSCRRDAAGAEFWMAYDRRAHGVRKARKRAAEVVGPVPVSVYVAIMKSGACVYCGGVATSVDHIIPLARGGHEAEYNLVPACGTCNSSKGDRLLIEWRGDRISHAVRVSDKVARAWEEMAA